jgi:hypothetical protein
LGTENCKEDVSGINSYVGKKGKKTGQSEKWGCDGVAGGLKLIAQAALKLGWPFQIVPDGGGEL